MQYLGLAPFPFTGTSITGRVVPGTVWGPEIFPQTPKQIFVQEICDGRRFGQVFLVINVLSILSLFLNQSFAIKYKVSELHNNF